jgi:hypothetical protein
MEVNEYIKRIAQRTGYRREFFLEKNIPTHPSNIIAMPFYGDLRSTFLLSSLLLKNFVQANRDKYLILCTWPGMRGLFPYVNEFWSIEDNSATKMLALNAVNFYNTSNLSTELTKSLLESVNILTAKDLKKYYDNGFTKEYWSAFKPAHRYLPEVHSASMIPSDFRRQLERRGGKKLMIYPSSRMRSRQQGRTVSLPIGKDFWVTLIERLIGEGYDPVVCQNWFTHDVSGDFADRCAYLVPKSVAEWLAAMRYVGCLLDVHTGVSRLAIAARCPFVAVIERESFVEDRDYEIDDLCCNDLPKQYLFGFSTHLMAGGPSDWKTSIIDNIVKRLADFMPSFSDDRLPSTAESLIEVHKDQVRKRRVARMGAIFLGSSKRK